MDNVSDVETRIADLNLELINTRKAHLRRVEILQGNIRDLKKELEEEKKNANGLFETCQRLNIQIANLQVEYQELKKNYEKALEALGIYCKKEPDGMYRDKRKTWKEWIESDEVV